jgi:hypothetical protein
MRWGLHRDLRSTGASPGEPLPLEVLTLSASRGSAPREGLGGSLMKMGHTKLVKEPRPGPQADKSGYPGSQNADSSPRAQGALGLGVDAKPMGEAEPPWALTTYGPD